MNTYTYDQIQIGCTESFSATVTAEMMDSFCHISGDINSLHCDEAYAQSMGYAGRVVYGMLTASLYSTLAGVYLPGKYCLLQGVDVAFRKPVFIGDTLIVSGTVAEKNDTFSIITVKATITSQSNEKVSKATLQIGFHNGHAN